MYIFSNFVLLQSEKKMQKENGAKEYETIKSRVSWCRK